MLEFVVSAALPRASPLGALLFAAALAAIAHTLTHSEESPVLPNPLSA